MKRIFFILLLMINSALLLKAHPHLYIDMEMTLEVNDQGITGIKQRWVLLRNFSPDLIEEFDKNRDGNFDEKEQYEIYQQAFLGANNYHFFTFITIENRDYASTLVKDFSAVIDGDTVIFTFRIPVSIQADRNLKSIEIVTYDPISYVSFGFQGFIDELNDNLIYDVGFVRDGNIYSHRNERGQLHVLIDLRLADSAPRPNSLSDTEETLKLLSTLPPLPEQTVSNPFLITGVLLDSDRALNPFLK